MTIKTNDDYDVGKCKELNQSPSTLMVVILSDSNADNDDWQ